MKYSKEYFDQRKKNSFCGEKNLVFPCPNFLSTDDHTSSQVHKNDNFNFVSEVIPYALSCFRSVQSLLQPIIERSKVRFFIQSIIIENYLIKM